jgi:hypothetical protein
MYDNNDNNNNDKNNNNNLKNKKLLVYYIIMWLLLVCSPWDKEPGRQFSTTLNECSAKLLAHTSYWLVD